MYNNYLDYLLVNFSNEDENYKNLQNIKDSANIQMEFIRRLSQDTTFNSVMMELADKTINEKIPKDTISMNFLLNVASKFFKIVGIDEYNRYRIKICLGSHGNTDTELHRKPQVEAFAFSIIMNNFIENAPIINKVFTEIISNLPTINLGIGIDNEKAILRAEGVVYYIVSKNKDFENFLQEEYQKNIDILPFVVKN